MDVVQLGKSVRRQVEALPEGVHYRPTHGVRVGLETLRSNKSVLNKGGVAVGVVVPSIARSKVEELDQVALALSIRGVRSGLS
jgi:hypothetical protein